MLTNYFVSLTLYIQTKLSQCTYQRRSILYQTRINMKCKNDKLDAINERKINNEIIKYFDLLNTCFRIYFIQDLKLNIIFD